MEHVMPTGLLIKREEYSATGNNPAMKAIVSTHPNLALQKGGQPNSMLQNHPIQASCILRSYGPFTFLCARSPAMTKNFRATHAGAAMDSKQDADA